MKDRALLIAAGFVVGAVLGVVVGVVIGASTIVPEGSGVTADLGEQPDTPNANEAAPVRAGDRRRTPSAEPDDPVALALAAVTVDLPTEGPGRITGTVRAPDGTPVAGVSVRAFPMVPDELDQEYEDDDIDLATRIRRYLRLYTWRAAALKTGMSGPDGKYVIDGMLDDEHWLDARAEGYEIETADGSDEEARDGDVVDFVATRQIGLDFSVVLPDGSTPESAQVVFTIGQGGTTYFNWPRQQRAYLQRGRYDVRATAGDEHTAWAATITGLVLSADAAPPPLEIELRARPGIAGRLVFEDGVAPSHVRVRMTSLPSGASASPALFAGKYVFQLAERDQRYRFRFLDLAPGEYVLAAEGLGGVGFDAMWTVAVADSLVQRELDVPAPDPARFVEIRVFDPAGRPTHPSYVELSLRNAGWVGARQRNALKRPGGALWVARMDEQSRRYPDARYSLSVIDKRYGRVDVELETVDAPTEIHFLPPARTEVTVPGFASSGHQSELSVAQRLVASGTSQPLPNRGAAPGIDGVATLPLVQPGEYDIVLVIAHNYLPGRPVARRRAVLEPGENRVTMAVPELHGLDVDVGEVGRAWTLRATSAGGLAERLGSFFVDAKPDAAGRVEFVRLPAGEYDVRAWSAGAPKEPRRMIVPAEGPVRF